MIRERSKHTPKKAKLKKRASVPIKIVVKPDTKEVLKSRWIFQGIDAGYISLTDGARIMGVLL
jgi:hypothetical protein